MNKKIINLCLIVFCFFLVQEETRAFEIPSYIEDPQDVSGNIDIIIEQNTPIRGQITSAQDLSDKTNETVAEYAARLYAEALSIRAGLTNTSKGTDSLKKSNNFLGSSNKQEILQNDVKNQVKNIALHLKQIVELETAIINLQSTQLLVNMDEVSTSGGLSGEEQ